jgi:hypothetical protein
VTPFNPRDWPRLPALASHLTSWDEAALLFTASLGLRLWLGPVPGT